MPATKTIRNRKNGRKNDGVIELGNDPRVQDALGVVDECWEQAQEQHDLGILEMGHLYLDQVMEDVLTEMEQQPTVCAA